MKSELHGSIFGDADPAPEPTPVYADLQTIARRVIEASRADDFCSRLARGLRHAYQIVQHGTDYLLTMQDGSRLLCSFPRIVEAPRAGFVLVDGVPVAAPAGAVGYSAEGWETDERRLRVLEIEQPETTTRIWGAP